MVTCVILRSLHIKDKAAIRLAVSYDQIVGVQGEDEQGGDRSPALQE